MAATKQRLFIITVHSLNKEGHPRVGKIERMYKIYRKTLAEADAEAKLIVGEGETYSIQDMLL